MIDRRNELYPLPCIQALGKPFDLVTARWGDEELTLELHTGLCARLLFVLPTPPLLSSSLPLVAGEHLTPFIKIIVHLNTDHTRKSLHLNPLAMPDTTVHSVFVCLACKRKPSRDALPLHYSSKLLIRSGSSVWWITSSWLALGRISNS